MTFVSYVTYFSNVFCIFLFEILTNKHEMTHTIYFILYTIELVLNMYTLLFLSGKNQIKKH